MTEIKGFRGLNVWQKSKALAVKKYEITGKGDNVKYFSHILEER